MERDNSLRPPTSKNVSAMMANNATAHSTLQSFSSKALKAVFFLRGPVMSCEVDEGWGQQQNGLMRGRFVEQNGITSLVWQSQP